VISKIMEYGRRVFRNQRGGVLVYLALGFVPFVAVMGLVLDYGEGVWCRTNMQKAVDAAALGGACFLPNASAGEKAAELADLNYDKYDNRQISFGSEKITVSMTRNVPTHFMRIFGQNDIPINVHATAIKPQPVGSIKGNMMPFCIINPNTNNDPNDDLTPAKWGKKFILQYGEDNKVIQDWANGNLGVGIDAPGIPVDYSKNNSEGWRAALRLDLSQFVDPIIGGASAFAYNFVNGYPGTIDIGDIIPTLTGNMTGPVFNPRAERLLGEEDLDFSNFNPDLDYNLGRVVYVPIVSLLDNGSTTDRYSMDDYYAGMDWDHTNVIVDGFAPFYLLTDKEQGDVNGDGKKIDKDWITGYFIPGTRAPIHSDEGGGSNFGLTTLPKLLD